MSTGADILVSTLEHLGIKHAFGIPGTHTTELYDGLDRSNVTPILVTDERSASFMACGYGSVSQVPAALCFVPGAGLTHGLSGIAEAYMDSVPMLIISSAIRNDTGKAFQLHDIDQRAIATPVTKKALSISKHEEIMTKTCEAFEAAISGEPGPAWVEVPANLFLKTSPVVFDKTKIHPQISAPKLQTQDLSCAIEHIRSSQRIGLYVGQGCAACAVQVIELADFLQAPVCWTFSGSGIYPANGPWACWPGFGNSAPLWIQKLFSSMDLIIAMGCKLGEVATGSYGIAQPKKLIHVDINPHVLNKNYKTDLAITADATEFVIELLKHTDLQKPKDTVTPNSIAHGREKTVSTYHPQKSPEGSVHPYSFFEKLRAALSPDAILVADSGNHTFLAAEHFAFLQPRTFLAPTDYSCMGYAIPASIGAKLARPDTQVVCLVGDGGLLMTGMEMITAVREKLGILFCVFNDGMLGLISQFQKTPLNRTPCTELSPVDYAAFAKFVGMGYQKVEEAEQVDAALREGIHPHRPMLLDLRVDYTEKTFFAKGVIKTNFNRLPAQDKLRMLGRALKRHMLG